MAKKNTKERKSNKLIFIRKNRSSKKVFWFFINLLLIAIFLYGLYYMWEYDWVQGLAIIVFGIIVIFLIKLFFKLRRKK